MRNKHSNNPIDDKLILLIARECLKSYEQHKHLSGSTEYALTIVDNDGEPLQVLSTPGTSGLVDWMWNVWMLSTKGVKRCSYLAADKVHEAVKDKINHRIPLAVTGHSKDASTALQYMTKYGADYCIAFCPAPAFRRFRITRRSPFYEKIEYVPLKNTATVYDPDDIVPLAGILNFGHMPVEHISKLPKDKVWYNMPGRVGDHLMQHIVRYFDSIV